MKIDVQGIIEITRLACIVFSAIAISLGVVGAVAFYRAPEAASNVVMLLIRTGNFTRMGIAVVIVLVVLVLRLTDSIDAQAAIATISGIAGYALGDRSSRSDTPSQSVQSQPPAPA